MVLDTGFGKAQPRVPDCTMIDWDDVRYFLAVARGGSVGGLPPSASCEPLDRVATRRQLEERLGARIFEKLPSGYRLTAAGEDVLEFADQMDASLESAGDARPRRDQGVRGLLRVTLAPPLATHLLMPDFAEFCAASPRESRWRYCPSASRLT